MERSVHRHVMFVYIRVSFTTNHTTFLTPNVQGQLLSFVIQLVLATFDHEFGRYTTASNLTYPY